MASHTSHGVDHAHLVRLQHKYNSKDHVRVHEPPVHVHLQPDAGRGLLLPMAKSRSVMRGGHPVPGTAETTGLPLPLWTGGGDRPTHHLPQDIYVDGPHPLAGAAEAHHPQDIEVAGRVLLLLVTGVVEDLHITGAEGLLHQVEDHTGTILRLRAGTGLRGIPVTTEAMTRARLGLNAVWRTVRSATQSCCPLTEEPR